MHLEDSLGHGSNQQTAFLFVAVLVVVVVVQYWMFLLLHSSGKCIALFFTSMFPLCCCCCCCTAGLLWCRDDRKLRVAINGRLALTLLPPRLATWRFVPSWLSSLCCCGVCALFDCTVCVFISAFVGVVGVNEWLLSRGSTIQGFRYACMHAFIYADLIHSSCPL